MTQSGGSAVMAALYVNDAFYCTQATYNLNSSAAPAYLSALQEYVGWDSAGNAGPGVFNQSSGTNAAGNLTIGQNGVLGSYNLSGGLCRLAPALGGYIIE